MYVSEWSCYRKAVKLVRQIYVKAPPMGEPHVSYNTDNS